MLFPLGLHDLHFVSGQPKAQWDLWAWPRLCNRELPEPASESSPLPTELVQSPLNWIARGNSPISGESGILQLLHLFHLFKVIIFLTFLQLSSRKGAIMEARRLVSWLFSRYIHPATSKQTCCWALSSYFYCLLIEYHLCAGFIRTWLQKHDSVWLLLLQVSSFLFTSPKQKRICSWGVSQY